MIEEVMHPTCKQCGKYIFAVDGCKGHKDKKEAPLPSQKPNFLRYLDNTIRLFTPHRRTKPKFQGSRQKSTLSRRIGRNVHYKNEHLSVELRQQSLF